MNMKKMQGFTLIELMIVVAIIAILAAIAISQYQDYVIRTQVSEGSSLAAGAKTAIGEYQNNRGTWPADNTTAGLAPAGSIVGNYVSALTIATGVITASYAGTEAHADLVANGGTLVFSPSFRGGSIQWTCKSAAIPQKWCASSCDCA